MSKLTQKRKFGDLGEDIAEDYLRKKGYRILDRNYLKKCGEIDIVAEKNKEIVFCEVKTAKKGGSFFPEENIHYNKQKRLARASETYLAEKNYSTNTVWRIDALIVEIDEKSGDSSVEHIEDAVFF